MKIDNFDNTLVCDREDLQTVFCYFKEFRVLPEYLEKSILKIVLEQIYKKSILLSTVKEYLNALPDNFIKNSITDINGMFSTQYKANYKQRYLTYLLYYLPANVYKVWKPLLDLLLKNTLKPNIRVLDVGTGPGSIPVGVIEFYNALAESFPHISFSIRFVLIEAEQEFINIAENILSLVKEETSSNLDVDIEYMICENVHKDSVYNDLDKFDLISMSNFIHINEGENHKEALSIITTFKNNLENDGSLIIIETGEKLNCQSLKKIRNKVVNNGILNVFSPCVGVWEEKTMYDCNCFNMVRCFWQLPLIYKYLESKGLHKGKRIDVPFNYIVLRKDNLKKYEIEKNNQHFIKLKEMQGYIGEIVNVKGIIRTVIYQENNINISLCDGSFSFSADSEAIWVNNISKIQLKKHGIDIPIIAAEKITLKKVLVKLNKKMITLEIGKNTTITIDY